MKSIDKVKQDYHLFIDIQRSKYFKSQKKETFDNDAEAKIVLDEIIKAYNDIVAPEHLKLDNLNPVAKNQWFNQIEIDFSKIINEINEFDEEFDLQLDYVSKEFDEKFSFLPKGSMHIFVFSGPALDAFGLPIERFETLVKGEKATEVEKDLIEWAFEVTLNVMDAVFSKSKKIKRNKLMHAIGIALEFLDNDTSEKVVQAIFHNILDTFNIPNKEIAKPVKAKRKK
jgi:hypothetical protein